MRGRIVVTIPSDVVSAWAGSEEVGIRAEQPTNSGGILRILVEKDFACLTQREGEDDSAAYPNPNRTC